jgi:hypothetical protein
MDRAMHGMTSHERDKFSKRWADPDFLPTSYARSYYRLDRQRDGKTRATLVGTFRVDSSGTVDDTAALAGSSPGLVTATGTGSGGRYDLYISIASGRRTCSGCYEFYIDNYADWRGPSGNGINLAEDSYGTSWAGDMYLYQDSKAGEYDRAADGRIYALDIYRSDTTPNEGVGWSFHEWKRLCGQCVGFAMNWADGTAIIRETTWKNRTDNVANKYLHSTSTGESFSLSFLNATISYTPPSGNAWTAAAYTTLAH